MKWFAACIAGTVWYGIKEVLINRSGRLHPIPEVASGQAQPGRCTVDYANQILGTFNDGLRSLVTQLNTNHPGASSRSREEFSKGLHF
nr:gdsl esterase/lipase [Quercus suber]